MPEITKARLKSLLAAEAFCQAARSDYTDFGVAGKRSYPWFEQWMRFTKSSAIKYGTPSKPHKTWCGKCRTRHIDGEP